MSILGRSNSRRSPTFRPRLEALEDRCLPSSTLAGSQPPTHSDYSSSAPAVPQTPQPKDSLTRADSQDTPETTGAVSPSQSAQAARPSSTAPSNPAAPATASASGAGVNNGKTADTTEPDAASTPVVMASVGSSSAPGEAAVVDEPPTNLDVEDIATSVPAPRPVGASAAAVPAIAAEPAGPASLSSAQPGGAAFAPPANSAVSASPPVIVAPYTLEDEPTPPAVVLLPPSTVWDGEAELDETSPVLVLMYPSDWKPEPPDTPGEAGAGVLADLDFTPTLAAAMPGDTTSSEVPGPLIDDGSGRPLPWMAGLLAVAACEVARRQMGGLLRRSIPEAPGGVAPGLLPEALP
jgi:hypothetical protein